MRESDQLRLLLGRINESPYNLVQTNLRILLNFINQDQYLRVAVASLLVREEDNLGAHAGVIWKNQADHVMSLDFISSLSQNAALGYQLLRMAAATGQKADQVGKRVVSIGISYLAHLGDSSWDMRSAIREFAKVFLEPLVDYLLLCQELDDQILAMLTRYKQRCEWFSPKYLMGIIESRTGQVEKALKIDFYSYLFDRGLDFAIDPKSPSGKGEVDVLSARFPDGRRLVLEAKVFDGKERDEDWVRKGLPQAAWYARDWAEPRAYLVVYNAAPNSTLAFAGVEEHGTYWVQKVEGVPVLMTVINLGMDVTASEAVSLKPIVI
jgi:hypothetical protein